MIWYKQDIILPVSCKILNVQDKYKIKKIKCLSVCLHVCTYACMITYGHMYGPPGVLEIWGEGLFIFRELGSKLMVLGI